MKAITTIIKQLLPTTLIVLALFVSGAAVSDTAFAKGPPPGKGNGPPDPPIDTPGLDPFTLAAIAGASYAGYQAYRHKQK